MMLFILKLSTIFSVLYDYVTCDCLQQVTCNVMLNSNPKSKIESKKQLSLLSSTLIIISLK